MKKIRNKAEFDELIEKIQENLEWYRKKNFDDKVYNLSLDNGEKLRICFEHKAIAHLLGINTEYLKATGNFPKDSYEIVKLLCNDPYRFYNMVNQGKLTYDSFISDYADDKLREFTNACGININDIEFVCKYSKEYSYITGYPQLEGDYYIGYKSNNGLLIVGLKNDGEYYVPITNRPIDYKDEEAMKFLKQLLENQSITMPSMSSIYFKENGTCSNTIFINDQAKNKKIRTINEYAKEYNASVDVGAGYNYIIEKLLKQYNSKNTTTPLLGKIFESIEKRLYINIKEIENEFGTIQDDIVELINKYNGSLNKDISAALDEHTKKVEEENSHLINENQRHIQELEELKRELLEAKTTIKTLQRENTEFKAREEETVEAMKRIYHL